MVERPAADFNHEPSIATLLVFGSSMSPEQYPSLPAHLAPNRDRARRLVARIRNLDGEVISALAERLAEPIAELVGQILGENHDI
jgi:hypothetical protein